MVCIAWRVIASKASMTVLETKPPAMPVRMKRRKLQLAVVLGLAFVLLASSFHRYASLDTLLALRDRFQSIFIDHRALAMLTYLLMYTVAVSLSLPGAIIFTLVSGAVFGWLAGGIIALLAGTLGASVVFLIARTAFGEGLAARAGPQVAKLQAGFCENALSYMLFLRLVPAFPFFVVNIVPALIGVPYRTYVAGTFFGIMPAAFAYSSAGAGLDAAILSAKTAQLNCRAARDALECPLTLKMANLVTPELTIAFALLSVLALLPVALKLWRRRHGN